MGPDLILFIDRSDSGNRQFVPGFILRRGEKSMLVHFDNEMDFRVNDLVVTHYRSGEQFLEQVCQITGVISANKGARYEFAPEGPPKSSDSRSGKRIPIHESLVARFGGEPDCPVLDISASGVAVIAVIADQRYEVGHTTSFEMWVRDEHYQGTVTIQNIGQAPHGRIRYGLRCNPDEGEQNLCRSMSRLWVALQRKCLDEFRDS